jgi:hypothetical protein
MPTNDRLSLSAATSGLRAQVDRVLRSVISRRPAVRWGLALVVLLGSTPIVYWAAMSWNTVGVRYLAAGRRLYSDDLIMVCRALDKQRIDYRVDDHRVEVAADQFDQAAELVAKLDLGQHAIRELRDDANTVSIFDPLGERENKKQIAREKIIEQIIGQLDGVVWSLVSINRPPPTKWGRPSSKPTAFVYIETEGKRQLPSQTIQSIPAILSGYEPELTPGSITVMDRRGVRYLDSGNLAVGDNARNRAREDELSNEILEKLDWIKGVRVQVKLISPRADDPVGTSVNSAPKQPSAPEHVAANQPSDDNRASRPLVVLPEMRVNHPLEPEPRSATNAMPAPPTASVAASRAVENRPTSAQSGERERHKKHELASVLIYIPRSYYLNADIRTDNREPPREELRALAERTENQVRTVVSLVTPESKSWQVDIFTIPDEVFLSRPVSLASPSDARHRALDWGIVGTVVAVVSVLAAVGAWVQVARRPGRVAGPELMTGRYHADSGSESGPSDRVRELVRRNPQAAASVLERWTGQGGRGS